MAEEVKLCQFQGDGKRFCLSLAPLLFHREPPKSQVQLITVDAMKRIAHGTVLVTIALDDLEQRSPLAVRHILHRDTLRRLADT